MRPKRKADPITIRLYIEENARLNEVFTTRFKKRYGFADLGDMIRLWLDLPVEDPKAVLTKEEKQYLSGHISALPEGHHGPSRPKEEVSPRDLGKRKSG